MSLKEIFKPTKSRVIFAIVLFIILSFTLLPNTICGEIARICSGEVNTQDVLFAKSVPFSCAQVCTNSEYYLELTKVITFNFLIPSIISYILSCLIISGIAKLKK